MIELYLLLGFIIVAAVIAVESHNLLSSVISVGAVGLVLCIIFLLLGAPELAVTQLVVEILVLIVLIRATLGTSVPETYKGREFLAYAVTTAFIAVFAAAAYFALRNLPHFGAPLMKVTAISLDFRGFDALAAVAVLFTTVIGTLTILRSKGRKQVNERNELDS